MLTRYSETFELPPGVGLRDLLAAFERVSDANPPAVAAIDEIIMAERVSWTLNAEITTPIGMGPHPIALYIHGGGWTTGTPRGYRRVAAEFAARGYLVVAPNYRRAPRHRFPGGFDDCRTAIDWVLTHGPGLGGDIDRMVVVGDSAGANLAAAAVACGQCAQAARAILLFYGIFDFYQALPVIGPIIGGPTRDEQLYLHVDDFDSLRADPRLNPILAADRLPPAFLAVGSRDPLLLQSRQMAAAISRLGRSVESHVYDASPHGFLQLPFTSSFTAGYDAADRFARSQF